MRDSTLDYLVIGLIILGAGNFLLTGAIFLNYDYDLDYSEGFVIENVEKMLEGEDLYPELNSENNYRSTKYPPLYYFLTGFISLLTGLNLFSGRIISFISVIGVSILLYFISRKYQYDKNSVVYLLPLVFLIPYLSIFTATTVRVDMLALFLSLGGFYFFLKDRFILSSLFFLSSFFTKQTFLSAFAASSIYLLYTRRKQIYNNIVEMKFYELFSENLDLIKFYSIFGIGVLTGFLLLYIWQPNIFTNIFGANLGGFDLRWDLLSWIHLTFFPVALGSLYGLYITRDKLLSLYLLFSTLSMLIQLLRGGAWVYAAIEPFAVSLLIIIITYRNHPVIRRQLNLLIILQVLVFFSAPMVSGDLFEIKHTTGMNGEPDSVINHYVEEGEPVYVEHVGYQLGISRTYSPEIWGMYELYDAGRITEEQVLNYFEEKQYEYIITYRRLENLPLDEFIDENYTFEQEVQRKDMILNEENWRVYRWTG